MAETSANASNADSINPAIGKDMNPSSATVDLGHAALELPLGSAAPVDAKEDSRVGDERNVQSPQKEDVTPTANRDTEERVGGGAKMPSDTIGDEMQDDGAKSTQSTPCDEPNVNKDQGTDSSAPQLQNMDVDGQRDAEEAGNGIHESPTKAADGPGGDESDQDPFADLDDVASMDIYDLSNYTFGKKNQESKSRMMQLLPKKEMTEALRKNYEERGMRRSVGGVILVHSHNFPHVLLLQRSDGKGEYALPGGRLRPGESDEEGLRRKLNAKLNPSGQAPGDEDQELDIGERISNWYAIDFQRRYYPYVPAHVTKVKEELHVYTVLLPNKFMFSVPKNLQLVAVPLFELFNNSSTYGDVISAIPSLLSRWHINYC